MYMILLIYLLELYYYCGGNNVGCNLEGVTVVGLRVVRESLENAEYSDSR